MKLKLAILSIFISIVANAADFTIQVNPANTSVGVPQLKTGLVPQSCPTGKQLKWTTASEVWSCEDIAVIPPTFRKITTVGSGTYITPVGAKYIRVRMVGGGGGAQGGSNIGSTPNGAGGGASTFGTSLLVAGGGGGGAYTGGINGGVGSLGSITTGFTMNGSPGFSGENRLPAMFSIGGAGGNSYFGGAGTGVLASGGFAGAANSGSGGSGGAGGTGNTAGLIAGSGGGAGAYVEALIYSPAASYPYTVGNGGAAGAPSGTGTPGGAGAAGIIIVEEYYQ